MTLKASSHTESRIRAVEIAVRRVRWFAVPFAMLQFALFMPPQGYDAMPFSRLGVGAAVVAALVAINLVSLAVTRRGDVAQIHRVGLAELVADTTLAILITILFGFDPTSRMWPLLLFPVIEGAMRADLRGAILIWAYASSAHVVEQVIRLPGRDDPAVWVGGIPWAVGILLAVALGTGLLANRLSRADRRQQFEAERLRRLAELSRAMSETREPEAVVRHFIAAAVELTGFEAAALYEYVGDDRWIRRGAQGTAADDRIGEQAHIPAFSSLAADLTGPTPVEVAGAFGQRTEAMVPGACLVVATPVVQERDIRGLLLTATRDPDRELSDDTQLILSLLTGHGIAALENARQLETELRTIEELRELDHMKDEFLSILTHELRSPMTAVAGYAELLRRRWEDFTEERREEFLASIERSTVRLSSLIEDVFDALRAERTEFPVETAPVDVVPLLAETAEDEVSHSPRHLLKLDVDHDTPPVLADPARLRQVVHNLVSNAVKYSPGGGTITVALQRDGPRMVAIAVGDEGLGIDPSQQPRLFDKFARLHPEERIAGTGLGLYLSRALVEAMGGTIDVVSEPGVGSTFTVHLRAAEGEAPTAPADREPPPR